MELSDQCAQQRPVFRTKASYLHVFSSLKGSHLPGFASFPEVN
jgi:hypothetical protein